MEKPITISLSVYQQQRFAQMRAESQKIADRQAAPAPAVPSSEGMPPAHESPSFVHVTTEDGIFVRKEREGDGEEHFVRSELPCV